MIIYSALFPDFYPFRHWYPDAKFVQLKHGQLPQSNEGFLIIWGGGDIHPIWYNRANVASHVYENPSMRDEQEVRMASRAIEIGLPILGVCRGAQLGCAMAGGILIQDVTGHGGSHLVKTKDGKSLVTSSLHHQMMYPQNTKHELLAWSAPSRSDRYIGLTEKELSQTEIEPEVVWFPEIKCLAIQGHPEFMDHDCEFNLYVHNLMDTYGFVHKPVS